MAIKLLLKAQSNQVFEAIKAAACEPADFDWQDAVGHQTGKPISQLIHNPSGYYFSFDNHGNFYSKWSPSSDRLVGSSGAADWPSQLTAFRQWLIFLKRETESPDLWAEISKGARVLESAASEASNAPFNGQEKAYILAGVNEIKQYLLTAHRLDPGLVEAQLKYLIESSERLGRKDWLNVLISVLVGIVSSAAFTSDATRELFHFVGTVLRNIIHQPLMLT